MCAARRSEGVRHAGNEFRRAVSVKTEMKGGEGRNTAARAVKGNKQSARGGSGRCQ